MYTVAVKRAFVAQHFLIGGDWGPENLVHSHHYTVELRLAGSSLDGHGFLVDIVDIEAILEAAVSGYRDRTLNELPEFSGLNPSIEHFSRILCQSMAEQIRAPNLSEMQIVIWEDQIAWAAFTLQLSPA